MKRFLAILIIALAPFSAWAEKAPVHHKVSISIDPVSQTIKVVDWITLPEDISQSPEFSLHGDLEIGPAGFGQTIRKIATDQSAQDVGIDRDNDDPRTGVTVSRYRIEGGGREVMLSYSGKIHHPIKQLGAEYARGFAQTPGIIDERGAYLAGSTQWLPQFGDRRVTYSLAVVLPESWKSVSQGQRIIPEKKPDGPNDQHLESWVSKSPQEEIYLIAAPFHEYTREVGDVTAMAMLRTPDAALANKYLDVTGQYLNMYEEMLGDYPYTKFALVENFWETGYGMPSFTLLGSEVIRLPFILHSSYPHELLHNWWGNGVYVDFETGNWCEGLTAYMADQLVAEQRGTGASYRRDILQRITDYVTPENDFPLNQFQSRYNAPSEAVGYGKTAMLWNMLRQDVGDERFRNALAHFYESHKYTRAGFGDIRESFEEIAGKDLKPFFTQWVDRTGAPQLRLANVKSVVAEEGYIQALKKRVPLRWSLELELEQVQPGDAYALDVPVVLYYGDHTVPHILSMTEKRQEFSLHLKAIPARVEVDPEFDLMRRLHYTEIPPALSKAFGAEQILILLPSNADDAVLARYRAMAEKWAAPNVEIKLDKDVRKLPKDKAVWVFGAENRHRKTVASALTGYDSSFGNGEVTVGAETISSDQSVIVTARHPGNTGSVLVYLTAHSDVAVDGLARKLPHYGKYSYLAFSGDEPNNSLKGQWPAVGSPLVKILDNDVTPAALPERAALATLPPPYSAESMMTDVRALAADEMEGRGAGTQGLEKAADYIAGRYEEIGLTPAGSDGWFQSFEMGGPDGPTTARNVIGKIAGSDPSLAPFVLSAHYDHLGLGWPNVREGADGQIHNGADDNASGVAVMLELARAFSAKSPKRDILVIAFAGEEAGLVGARHFVANAETKPFANVNLDTVGRLGDNPVTIFGASTARELRFIFLGATAVTGVESSVAPVDLASSDNIAFAEAQIPAVQIFGGDSPDYHRPSDDADKIDGDGLVKVTQIAAEAVDYLANRAEPLVFTGEGAAPAPAAESSGARRAATGTTPDFTFAGPGVRITAVADGSGAEVAGLQAGDVITSLADQPVNDLRDYSNILKTLAPGDSVSLTFVRDGSESTAEITLGAR